MPSVYKEGSNKPEPADPKRMDEINNEIVAISERVQKLGKQQMN